MSLRPLLAAVLIPCLACATWETPPVAAPPDAWAQSAQVHEAPPEAEAKPSSTGLGATAAPPTDPLAEPDPSQTDSPERSPGLILPAPGQEESAGRDDLAPDPANPRRQKVRNGLFWTGVALAGVGGAGFLGFGIAGRVTQKRLADGYGDGSLTRAREQQLRDRGDSFNEVAIAGITTGVVGVMLFSLALGLDYANCGKLTRRRRSDCPAR